MYESLLPAAIASDAAPAAAVAVTTAASSIRPDGPAGSAMVMPAGMALFTRRGSGVSAAADTTTTAVTTLPALSWWATGSSGTRTNAVEGRLCGGANGSSVTAVAASSAAGSGVGFKVYRYLLLLFSPVSIARRTTKSDDSSNLSMIACAIGSVMAELSPILEATAASCLDFRH